MAAHCSDITRRHHALRYRRRSTPQGGFAPRHRTRAATATTSIFPGQAYAAMVRSPHAHARIRAIDVTAARAMPGVLAVLTGEDAARRRAQAHSASRRARHGARHRAAQPRRLAGARRAALRAADRSGAPCRHARSPSSLPRRSRQAKDAAEKVVVDYEPLPVVTEGTAGAESDAPRLYDDLPNVMIDAEVGDAAATDAGVRARRPCHAARHLGQSRHRRADGAARGRRPL